MSIEIEPQAYPYLLAIGAIFLAIMLIIITIIRASNKKAKKAAELRRQMKAEGILYSHSLPILSGLNIPEGSDCRITSLTDKIEIESNGVKYVLNKDKILNVCTKTNTELEKQYVSSAGGAVGGAMLFGPVGALIGGRAKQKINRSVSTYLIFTYDKNGIPDYVAFTITGVPQIGKQFLNEFEGKNQQKVINL